MRCLQRIDGTTDFTFGEYIRNRRLALAGNEVAATDTKAFTRFHGVTPIAVRKDGVLLKSFAPLKIKISLEGGYLMDYRIEKKEAFTVIANAKTFDYLIADSYRGQEVPEGFITKTIPAFDWAVFPSTGALPEALMDVNKKIYTEWLSALKEYEFAAGYCVEYYEDPTKYAKGTQDDNYYCEIWIPVKKK